MEEVYYPDDESICPDDSASQFGGPHTRFSRPKPATAKLTAAALNQREGLSVNEQPPEYFNSWDTSGRQHMQRRTDDSEVGSIRSFDTRELSTALSSEDRFSRDTTSSVRRPEVPGRNRKWAKIVSIREAYCIGVKGPLQRADSMFSSSGSPCRLRPSRSGKKTTSSSRTTGRIRSFLESRPCIYQRTRGYVSLAFDSDSV